MLVLIVVVLKENWWPIDGFECGLSYSCSCKACTGLVVVEVEVVEFMRLEISVVVMQLVLLELMIACCIVRVLVELVQRWNWQEF